MFGKQKLAAREVDNTLRADLTSGSNIEEMRLWA